MSSMDMMKSIPVQRSCKSTLSDWIVIVLIYTAAMIMEWVEAIHPNKQYVPGYDDNTTGDINYSLSYPYQKSTIATPVMFFFCGLIWSLLLIIVGIILWQNDPNFTLKSYGKFVNVISRSIWFSFAVASLITDIVKKTVGSPRPYFLTAQELYDNEEISRREYDNARQSFMSGHASESWSMLFLLTVYLYNSYAYTMKCASLGIKPAPFSVHNPHSFFLQNVWRALSNIPLFSIGIIFSPCYLALYISLSRITDYKHTAADITAGALIGACTAYLSFLVYYNETFLIFEFRQNKANHRPNVMAIHSKSMENHDIPTNEIRVNVTEIQQITEDQETMS